MALAVATLSTAPGQFGHVLTVGSQPLPPRPISRPSTSTRTSLIPVLSPASKLTDRVPLTQAPLQRSPPTFVIDGCVWSIRVTASQVMLNQAYQSPPPTGHGPNAQ